MAPRKPPVGRPFEDRLSRAIVDLSPDATWVHAEGLFVWANQAAVRMTGFERLEDLVGRRVVDFVSPEDRERLRRRLGEYAVDAELSDSGEFRFLRPDGSGFSARVDSRVLDVDGDRYVLTTISDTSPLAETVRALRESEERYRTLVELSPDLVFVHSDNVVVYANRACVRAAGGSDVGDLVGMPVMGLISNGSRGRSRERVRHILDTGKPLPAEILGFERLDGTSHPVEIVAMPMMWAGRPAVQVIGRDLTDREEADRALAESEARYRTLVEMSPDAILVHDGVTIFYANDAGLRLYGAGSLEDMVGARLATIVDPGSIALVDTRVRSMFADDEPAPMAELRMRRIGGECFDAEVIACPIRFEDRPAILVMVRDTSERKSVETELSEYRYRLEQLVDERTSELIESNNQLAAATAAKDSFLAAMSHELRTPLNSIIGFSGVMAQGLAGPLAEEQERQVGMINRSGRKLLGLVDDMLDLTRIEAGRVDVRYSDVDLSDLASRLRDMIEPLATEKGIDLIAPSPGSLPPVRTDEDKLEQILLNLLTNAVKNTDIGEVELTFAISGDGELRVSVRDTGQGIPETEHERIFLEFHQLPSSTEAKRPGTGLGLAIVRRLAGLLDGRVELESVPGSGSTFTLVLPA